MLKKVEQLVFGKVYLLNYRKCFYFWCITSHVKVCIYIKIEIWSEIVAMNHFQKVLCMFLWALQKLLQNVPQKMAQRKCISQFQLCPAHHFPPPGLLLGICLPYQSWGWGISKLSAVEGQAFANPGATQSFDTHVVSNQKKLQRILRENQADWSSVKDRKKL